MGDDQPSEDVLCKQATFTSWMEVDVVEPWTWADHRACWLHVFAYFYSTIPGLQSWHSRSEASTAFQMVQDSSDTSALNPGSNSGHTPALERKRHVPCSVASLLAWRRVSLGSEILEIRRGCISPMNVDQRFQEQKCNHQQLYKIYITHSEITEISEIVAARNGPSPDKRRCMSMHFASQQPIPPDLQSSGCLSKASRNLCRGISKQLQYVAATTVALAQSTVWYDMVWHDNTLYIMIWHWLTYPGYLWLF